MTLAFEGFDPLHRVAPDHTRCNSQDSDPNHAALGWPFRSPTPPFALAARRVCRHLGNYRVPVDPYPSPDREFARLRPGKGATSWPGARSESSSSPSVL